MSTSALAEMEREESAGALFPFANTSNQKLNSKYTVSYIDVIPVLNIAICTTTLQVKGRRSTASPPASLQNHSETCHSTTLGGSDDKMPRDPW